MAQRGRRRAAPRADPQWHCSACKEFNRHEVAGAALQRGLQALQNSHRGLVEGEAECGLEFDSAFEQDHGDKNRFDYLFVRKADCEVIAVEVHPASSTGNINELIQKKVGTERILAAESIGVKVRKWCWVASGRVVFSTVDKYGIRLSEMGISQPRRRARFDEDD